MEDGDWSTWGGAGCLAYVNYTKPIYSLSSSLWLVKDDCDIVNLTIPQSCWDYSSTKIILNSFYVGFQEGVINWSCYNGDWISVRSSSPPTFCGPIYEEAMWWDLITPFQYNDTIQMNVTLTDNVSLSNYIFSWNCSTKNWQNDSIVYINPQNTEDSASCTEPIFGCPGAYDEDWATWFGMISLGTEFHYLLYENYTIPTEIDGANITAQFKFSGDADGKIHCWNTTNWDKIFDKTGIWVNENNFTSNVSSPCLSGDTLQIRTNISVGAGDAVNYYEQQITWINLTNITISTSKTINATKHPVCGWTVYFNTTTGTINQTDIFTFEVVNTPPNVPILLYPEDSATLAHDYTLLNYSTTDNDNDTINYYVLAGTNNPPTTLAYNGTNTSFNLSGLITGNIYYWRVHADDGIDNSSNSTIRTFFVSSLSPAINIRFPLNNDWNTSQTDNISISFTATDNSGVDLCQFWINSTGWHLNQTKNITNDLVSNFTINLTDETRYFYNIWCNDSLGNGGFNYQNITFGIDTTKPKLTITSPTQDTTYNTETLSLTILAEDVFLNTCSYILYFKDVPGSIKESNSNTNCAGTTSMTTTYYAGGYRLNVTVNDLAGNINFSVIDFTTEVYVPPAQSGGGAIAPEKIIIEREVEVRVTTCGNTICEAGEDPRKCPQDCKLFSFEEMFCLPLFNCGNWKHAWFVNLMVIVVITSMIYLQHKSNKIKRPI